MATQKRSMYNVDQTKKGKMNRTLDGILYDSKSEMLFVVEWILPKLEAKEIKKWERQVPYILQEEFIDCTGKKVLQIKYIADYKITMTDDSEIVIDVKGMPDSVSKIKKKLLMYKYPNMDYRWYCRNIKRGGWLLYEDLEKMKREEKKQQKAVNKYPHMK